MVFKNGKQYHNSQPLINDGPKIKMCAQNVLNNKYNNWYFYLSVRFTRCSFKTYFSNTVQYEQSSQPNLKKLVALF